jgi:hypothetical protein
MKPPYVIVRRDEYDAMSPATKEAFRVMMKKLYTNIERKIMSYDSIVDVLNHKEKVTSWINMFIRGMEYRTNDHDNSKLIPPEKEMFDIFTPKLKEFEFGSDEYKQALIDMGVALQHHYQMNSHHPEHYENGVDGMNLFDLIEMFCDWCAAAETKMSSINMEYLSERFKFSSQLTSIFENTLKILPSWEVYTDR